jgi:sugar lactone lactonase YvrE
MFVLLVLTVLTASTAVRAQTPTVSFSGVQKTIGSGIVTPQGVAVDAQGDVFITDAGNTATGNPGPRMVEIPAGGGPQFTVGSGFGNPYTVAVDGAGNLFVADPKNQDVVRIPNGGGPQTTVGIGLFQPTGVAVDGAGNVFIADMGNHRVLEVSANGGPQTVVDSQLDAPTGVAVDRAGNVFIADELNGDVYKVPAGGGTPILVAPILGAFQVAVDIAGNLFVSTIDGSFVEISAGGVKTTLSAFAPAAQVALDDAGDVFLGNLELDRSAVKLANANVCPAGKTSPAPCSQSMTLTYNVLSGGTVSSVNALTQGEPGLDFTVGATTCLGSLNTGASCTVTVNFTPKAPGLRLGEVQLINGSGGAQITLSSALLYGLASGPAIGFDPNAQTTVNVTSSKLATGEFVPSGVAVDANGDVFVSDTDNNRVVEVPASGGAQVTLGSGLAGPRSLAIDGAGDLFIADTGNNRVVEVLAGGGYQFSLGSGLSQPHGVAVDGAGNVFIADTGNRRIVEIAAYSSGEITLADGFIDPYGVAVDANGDVFVVDGGLSEVIELPAGGGESSVVATNLNSPNGLAIDPAGNVIIADTNNSRVVEFPAGGGEPIDLYLASAVLPYAVAADGKGHVFIAGTLGVLELHRSVPPTLSFTSGVGTTSNSKLVTVQNIGNQPLNAVTPGFTIGTDFEEIGTAASTSCTTKFSLTPGAYCDLNLSFTPPAIGSFTGTAVLTDNALNASAATQTINLSGTGKALLTPKLQILTGPFVYDGNAHGAGCRATGTGGVSVSGFCSFTYNGSSNTPISAGTYTVKANFTSTNPYYANTTGTATLTIEKVPLTITGNNRIYVQTFTFPGLSVSYSGFVNGETPAALQGALSISTIANPNSPVGNYPIAPGGLTSTNYTITYVNGTLSVLGKGPGPGTYYVQNVNSGMVLGVAGASTSQGANIVQWLVNGSSDQVWKLSQLANGAYVFTDVNSGWVIGVAGASLNYGTPLIQWASNNSTDQNWYFIQNGVFWNIQDVKSGLYMDISGGSTTEGADALQGLGNGGQSQLWTLTPTT